MIMPEMQKDYGYDLEMCQYTPPMGKGSHADILIRIEGSHKGPKNAKLRAVLGVSNKSDGFVMFITETRESGPDLISDYHAPETEYINSMEFAFDSDNMMAAYNQPKNSNFYFRVRTKLNPDGTIASCNYGKVYGPLLFWALPIEQGGLAQFSWSTSYFNPTPNDRNVEFDPKRNLIPDGNVQRP
jgi:hypothetical protein